MGMNLGGGRARKGRSNVRPEMNVTPLVDVVLVLLIIFMVVTPLLTKKFWLHVPKKDEKTEEQPPPPPSEDKSVVVSVDDKDQIRINGGETVTEVDLPEKLRRIFAARQDHVIFFDAHDGVEFGRAVQVMDIARGAGAVTIAVLTEKL